MLYRRHRHLEYSPMRVMYVPKSVQIIDSIEFAVGLHESRSRQINRIGGEHAGLYVPLQASPYLAAYMAWPNDEPKRDEWLAAVGASRISADSDANGRTINLKLLAGPALEAKVAEIVIFQVAWTAVADVFQRLIDMAKEERVSLRGGPSISKAIALCELDKTYSRAHLERFWSQYRDVAHLITAAAFLASRVQSGTGSVFTTAWTSPDAVIGIADGFELFGLSNKPHGKTDTFLAADTTWRLPEHCCKEKPFLAHRPLSDEQIRFLQLRRSRNEYISKNK
jgi:hypothetical protein